MTTIPTTKQLSQISLEKRGTENHTQKKEEEFIGEVSNEDFKHAKNTFQDKIAEKSSEKELDENRVYNTVNGQKMTENVKKLSKTTKTAKRSIPHRENFGFSMFKRTKKGQIVNNDEKKEEDLIQMPENHGISIEGRNSEKSTEIDIKEAKSIENDQYSSKINRKEELFENLQQTLKVDRKEEESMENYEKTSKIGREEEDLIENDSKPSKIDRKEEVSIENDQKLTKTDRKDEESIENDKNTSKNDRKEEESIKNLKNSPKIDRISLREIQDGIVSIRNRQKSAENIEEDIEKEEQQEKEEEEIIPCTCGIFLSGQFKNGQKKEQPKGFPVLEQEMEMHFKNNPVGVRQCTNKCLELIIKHLPKSNEIVCAAADRDEIFKERAFLLVKNFDEKWHPTNLSAGKVFCCRDGLSYKCPV